MIAIFPSMTLKNHINFFAREWLEFTDGMRKLAIYYRPRAICDLYRGIYRVGYILFVYNGAMDN